MFRSTAGLPRRLPRRLILGTAFLLALAVSLPARFPAANAQDARPAGDTAPTAQASPSSSSTPAPASSPAAPAPVNPPAAPKGKAAVDIGSHGLSIDIEDKTAKDSKAASEPSPAGEERVERDAAGRTLTIRKNGKTVRVTGIPADREFDSVDQFMHNEPALASMVVGVVVVVFFAPVIAIALVVFYRIRKARMLNETMLKLAEKGIIAPAEALDAISAGKIPVSRVEGSAAAAGNLASLQNRARDVRRRVAWSDLRKGVIMGTIGLAITLYSFFDDRTPNVLGLVLLFVGIGYAALWYFEERQLPPAMRDGGPGTSPPGGDGAAGSP